MTIHVLDCTYKKKFGNQEEELKFTIEKNDSCYKVYKYSLFENFSESLSIKNEITSEFKFTNFDKDSIFFEGLAVIAYLKNFGEITQYFEIEFTNGYNTISFRADESSSKILVDINREGNPTECMGVEQFWEGIEKQTIAKTDDRINLYKVDSDAAVVGGFGAFSGISSSTLGGLIGFGILTFSNPWVLGAVVGLAALTVVCIALAIVIQAVGGREDSQKITFTLPSFCCMWGAGSKLDQEQEQPFLEKKNN